jgi:hypothetical protein
MSFLFDKDSCIPSLAPNMIRLLAFLLLATLSHAASRPNVLFILCDDIRPDTLGCYGSKHVKTPNIDRLANEGIVFKNTFCTTSLCSPSRGSILGGLYAHAHGVTNNFTEFPADMPSFPGLLHDSGYATAYFGKYHMGEDNDDPRPGYDTFVTHKGQGKYYDTEWNLNGKERKVIKGYYTTVVTDLAMDWLKQQSTDKPWCAFIGHKAPHSFYTPEPKYEHTFDDVRVPYPATAFMLDDKPAWIKQRLYTWHGIYGPLFEWRKKFPDDSPAAVKDFENMVHGYWGTVLSVDDSVARLRTWLEETKQLDNTIIVFMGDNGLLEGEDGMVDKRTAHEASLRIPLVVRYAPQLTKESKDHRQADPHGRCGPEHARTLRRATAEEDARQILRQTRPKWRSRLAHELVLPLQLREAVPLHAERPRCPHRRLEIHPLPARRRLPTSTWPSSTTSKRSRRNEEPHQQTRTRWQGRRIEGRARQTHARHRLGRPDRQDAAR